MGILRTTLVSLCALAVPATAWGVAVPVGPTGGAKVSTPTLTWTKDADDLVDEVAIATSKAVDGSGALVPGNIVDSSTPGNAATTWTSTNSGLWAGPYWWVVKTHKTAAPAAFAYSTPASFRLKTSLRCSPPRGQAQTKRRLYLTISCISNAHTVRVRLVVKRGGVTVKTLRRTVKVAHPNDSQASATFVWAVPGSIGKGTILRLAARATASEATVHKVGSTTAP